MLLLHHLLLLPVQIPPGDADAHGAGAEYDAVARGDQAGVGPSGEPGASAGSTEAALLDTGRLFVRNLAYAASEGDLRALFGQHGQLEEVHLVIDRWAGSCAEPG